MKREEKARIVVISSKIIIEYGNMRGKNDQHYP